MWRVRACLWVNHQPRYRRNRGREMGKRSSSGQIYYDAEQKRFDIKQDREVIPKRLVYAMFGLAGLTLVLTTGAVLSGRTPTGVPPVEPAVATHVVTISGNGDYARVVDAEGKVLLDAENGAFVAVVRNGLDTARFRHRVEGNPPVEIIEWESGRMTLHDPATGWKVELSSFGRGNLTHFRRLFH